MKEDSTLHHSNPEEPFTPKDEELTPDGPNRFVENNGDNIRASWSFGLNQIRANIQHYDPESKRLLVAAFLWCTDTHHPVHRKDFARRVGYDQTTIWKIYMGKYRSPAGDQMEMPKKLIKGIRDFLELEKERHLTGKTEFVITPTATSIFRICDMARESQTPGFIWGHSHCGKTWALERYCSSNNHGRTTYCRMHAASGLHGMLQKIATSVGVSDKNNTKKLIKFIISAVTPDMLLILDEIHELMYTYRKESFFACLEVIREIYDETKCGMVLSGTKLMMEKIEGAKHAELEQLLARGVHRLALMTAPTRKDLVAIFKHNGLEFPDRKLVLDLTEYKSDSPYEVIHQLATTQRLKAITERIRYARKFASLANEKLAWIHFLQAHHEIKAQWSENPEQGEQW